jgi:hypothetical protein
MLINKIFYNIKPFIPRHLQISLRRQMAAYKRKKYGHIWPVDPNAGTPPNGWPGWPDNKKFALIISHDVDTQAGHDKCYPLMEIEERLGFRSSFSIIPENYVVSKKLIDNLKNRGFEVCVHGLKHDGKLFFSKKIFNHRAKRINYYLQEWGTTGFTSPSMLCRLDWLHGLNINYSTSTYDTDPFEPQQHPVGTIFPFWVQNKEHHGIDQKGAFPEGLKGFVELPYTLPQDFTLFILMKEKNISIWKKKLDWIAEKGGMALFNSHPDYMNFNRHKNGNEEYAAGLYIEFLEYIKKRYKDQYWHVLPKQMAQFWRENHSVL